MTTELSQTNHTMLTRSKKDLSNVSIDDLSRHAS